MFAKLFHYLNVMKYLLKDNLNLNFSYRLQDTYCFLSITLNLPSFISNKKNTKYRRSKNHIA